MFWAPGVWTPKHVHLLLAVFLLPLAREVGYGSCKLGEELNANNDK